MKMWKKVTKTLGSIWAPLLVGSLLGTTMVLFTRLPMLPRGEHTLDANTFGKNESLDVRIKLKSGEELQVKVTGASTMEVVQNLQKILKNLEKSHSIEKYSHSIKLLEG